MPADPRSSSDRNAQEHRLQLLLDCVQDHAICLISPGGAILDWNGGAQRILGYAADEIVGRHFGRFYTQQGRASGEPEAALETARRRGRHETEGWRQRRDGGRFWASATLSEVRDRQGEMIGFAHVVRDITERRVAQEALRQSERQFRLLVNGVSDHALFMLDPNGIVVSWNAGAERIKGYAADEIIGQHYSKFFTEADRREGKPMRALQAAIEHGRYEGEGWRMRRDGALFWANFVLHALREDGALVGFAKITRDTTERRAAQLELQKTEERLFHAQKLEALGQLTGGVAHDFNNLLMVIGGQAELLVRRAEAAPEVQRSAEMIAIATQRGKALTRQLLSFARRQSMLATTVDLPARINGFKDIIAKSAGPSVNLTLALPADLWPVEVDPNELELALINLVVNSRDAMPEGGSVTITAENVMLKPGDAGAELDGEFVELAVSDEGVGIPPDIVPKVFDPFFTTKNAGRGTGLGLSQVYGFARQAGGAASVASVLGRGARVMLHLPRAASQSAEAPEAFDAPEAGGLALVVEDNPEVAEATTGLMQLMGYRTRTEASGEAALSALEEGLPFSLVISDVVMGGGMDGLALARRLRADRPELPVVLVSGYAKAIGDVGPEFPVLQKPFSLEELERAVGRARAHAAANAKVISLASRRGRPKTDDEG